MDFILYMKLLTKEEFVKRFTQRYPERRYDFSDSVYVNSKVLMDVKCLEHGAFKIRPVDLINGYGCPYCGGTKKYSTKEFIEKATRVHNGFFEYKHTEYKGSGEKLIVTCPVHGDFVVKANNHLNGANCQKCRREGIKHKITKLPKVNSSTKRLTTETFIEKANLVHSNFYSYEKTKYERSNKKLIVTCPIHGDFSITPNHHLSGRGCSYCGKNKQLTTDEFIEKANNIHEHKYLYFKTVYTKTHNDVIITCPEHGDFLQSPANHLKGQGCPKCNESKLEKIVMEYLSKHNIQYKHEAKFVWLKSKRNMRLDFFLPYYNAAIECQGIQHFSLKGFVKKQENLNEIKKRDELKKNLCEEHGIKLFYFSNLGISYPYHVYENIELMFNDIKQYKN